MTEPKIFCKRLKNIYLEVMIKLSLRKIIVKPKELIDDIVLGLSRGNTELILYRIFDMIPLVKL